MESYFRGHRGMGARDRREVTETVYACLRHRRLLAHLAGSSDPRDVVAAYWLRRGVSPEALAAAGFGGDGAALAVRVREADIDALPLAVRASLPDWLAEPLCAQYGPDEAAALADALNRPAPVDLRVNMLKARPHEVRARLAEQGIACAPTPYAPAGLRLAGRAPVSGTDAFKKGWFEVQDEGSQIVSLLLEPRRDEVLVDLCAGAGGKTLHLGALSGNSGTIHAFDISPARLERLLVRARRAGLANVHATAIAHEQDARVQRLRGKIDRVLVDAPCSGTGTLRRSPELKWRPVDLPACVQTQERLLEAAASLLKPGGRLVYATCSVLAEENQAVVARFRAAHPQFALLPAGAALARRRVPLKADADGSLRLLPHRHGTDGFYAAVLERTT